MRTTLLIGFVLLPYSIIPNPRPFVNGEKRRAAERRAKRIPTAIFQTLCQKTGVFPSAS